MRWFCSGVLINIRILELDAKVLVSACCVITLACQDCVVSIVLLSSVNSLSRTKIRRTEMLHKADLRKYAYTKRQMSTGSVSPENLPVDLVA